ncbi:hypothetical protein OGAPHI_006243 [Ogataea philodendri]|uniref:Uncharacterized protein n=1 Tax=Ogataea philodendri TaxID=1378263 RepID=A0A9P8NYY4_9ASCO|nr:uncharacterized protein OGAPHI_006243 [Ogataea philodendri]KAH3662062.1 hypothetical protein OGAPHI_006243 [Ogataea philodendri]
MKSSRSDSSSDSELELDETFVSVSLAILERSSIASWSESSDSVGLLLRFRLGSPVTSGTGRSLPLEAESDMFVI